ncbi:MAG: DUF2062 domain-containing protein [Lentisphaeria bacterium]|nr:DUF2062 domain-containing protein [Lentisphaeria bacterium]
MKFTQSSRKWWLKIYTKMVGENASVEYIARGWAIGMFYGCFIPFGFQLALSVPTSFWLKGSKVGAVLGTLITNPFTIFIIYPVQCYVGNKLIGGSLSYAEVSKAMADVVQKQDYSTLFGLSLDLILSFFTGGALLTVVMTPLTYFAVKYLVEARRKRKAAKAAKAKGSVPDKGR